MNIHFTYGDREEAISIMQEAAQWLISVGQPMWNKYDLTVETLKNPANEYWVMWDDMQSVSAMTLSFEDTFFWPTVLPNTSGFIHKLSVRRKYASKGYSKMMVEHAIKICQEKGISHLRLDCDPHRPKLMQFYFSCGFNLLEIKQIYTPKLGKIDLAMFEMKI